MHVPEAERDIRVVKEITKATVHGLPYNCPLAIFAFLPIFATSSKKKGVKTTVAVYVDDLLILSNCRDDIASLIDDLRAKYDDVKTTEGSKYNYLGMVIDLSFPPHITINQTGMVEDIISSTKNAIMKAETDNSPLKKSPNLPKSPAAPYLFDIADNSMPLSDSLRVIFHSVVAKLIYISTRTRHPYCGLIPQAL